MSRKPERLSFDAQMDIAKAIRLDLYRAGWDAAVSTESGYHVMIDVHDKAGPAFTLIVNDLGEVIVLACDPTDKPWAAGYARGFCDARRECIADMPPEELS